MKKAIIIITAIFFLILFNQNPLLAKWKQYGNIENDQAPRHERHHCQHRSKLMTGEEITPFMYGCGMSSAESIAEYRKYLAETKELRKKLHDLKFEYHEAAWNPETTLGDLEKMQEKMLELQKEIEQKIPTDKPESDQK